MIFLAKDEDFECRYGRVMFIAVTLVSALLLISFFLLISYSKVRLVFHRKTRLEITVAFLKLELYNFEKSGGKRPSFSFYRHLLKRLQKLFSVSRVVIEELDFPISIQKDEARYTSPYRYHTAVSALIAYIGSHSHSLDIIDDAVNVYQSDNKGDTVKLKLTARTRLFYILKTVYFIVHDKRKSEQSED